MKTFNQFQEDMSKLPGLGGGGGGTDAITDKSKSKSLKKRVGDVGKILTRPFRKVKKDPTEKFASEEVAIANNASSGNIAGLPPDDPPVKKNKRGSGMKSRKKKTYAYGGRGSRKMWMT